jgi:hypothetical protein
MACSFGDCEKRTGIAKAKIIDSLLTLGKIRNGLADQPSAPVGWISDEWRQFRGRR